MKHGKFVMFGACALAVLFFASCDSFFSASWGSERDYDESKIDINEGNYQEWLSAAVGNPKLAKAVTSKLKKSSSTKLRSVGVQMAVESAGLGTLVIGNLNIISDIADADDKEKEKVVKDLLDKIQGNFKPGSAGAGAADDIAALVKGDIGSGSKFSDEYAAAADAAEVSQAIMILSMAIVNDPKYNLSEIDGDTFDSITDLTVSQTGMSYTGSDPKVAALAAYVNLAGNTKYAGNPVTDGVQRLLTK